MWELISLSPQEFRGGGIWRTILNIHGALKAIGFALLILFFVAGIVKTCGSLSELRKPEHALRLFVRFALAKAAVDYGLELMLAVFGIAQGIIRSVMSASGFAQLSGTTLPAEIAEKIESVGFWESIPLWLVTLLGSLLIWVMSLILLLTVYARFFKLYIATAVSSIPMAAFAGEPTSGIGKAFLRSYAAICLEGCVIVLSCILFSAFASSPPAVDTSASAVTAVWSYIGELAFDMLVLTGSVKMSDRIVRELMGLG